MRKLCLLFAGLLLMSCFAGCSAADGKIAVLTEDGAFLLDPLTGERCGEADPALFEE